MRWNPAQGASKQISRQHRNRRAHNWLAYEIGDRFLAGHVGLYKGVLYDLGAGESAYREFFLRHADKYVAVDWSDSFHETRADIIADLNGLLPIDNDVADTVVSLSVLEHLREPEVMLREAFRILRPGGWGIIQVPWQWWIHEAPYDFFRFTPFALEYLLAKAGFTDISVTSQAGFFTMLILKFNYFTRRAVRGPRALRWLLLGIFSVLWYVGQKAAPFLDKLDTDWRLEAPGYFVTARKPSPAP